MKELKLLSFSLHRINAELFNIGRLNIDLSICPKFAFNDGKYWWNTVFGILLMLNSISSFAQTSGTQPTTGISNCTITPVTSVCPNSVTTYSAPSGMTGYVWSILGAGTISGPMNGRTVNVKAGPNCNNTFKLTISYMTSIGGKTCTQSIPIVDNTLPKIAGAPNKSVPFGTTDIVFDNPEISDVCSAPTLVVLSTTSNTLSDGTIIYTRTWKATDVCGNSSSTFAQTVTVNAALTCSIIGSNVICSGGSTELCASPNATSYLWSTGASTQCITVTNAGTYSVTVSDASSTSTCSKIVTISPQPNCLISGNGTLCSGGNTELCAASGAASYLWNTGSTNECITVLSAGTYSVTATDVNGCTSTCSKSVTAGTSSSCTISGSTSICTGGSANLCAPAGAISYLWNSGGTTQCINVESAGTYSVTLTNSSGCSSTCSKIINEKSPPNCSITGNLFICPGGSTQICSPAGLASYRWSTGETSQCITVNTINNYNVIVTGANGCTASCSQTVDGQTLPACTITGNTNLCPGGTTDLCSPGDFASYSWNTGATTQCIAVKIAGVYTVTNTNANGCSSTCSKTISSSNPPTCSISSTNTCGSSSLCASSGFVAYSWSTGETTKCITVFNSGTYTVTLTNENGCTSTCSKNIAINTPHPCYISGNNSICQGSSTNLCVPEGAKSYLWSTGETTSCISVNSEGNYSVTVVDAIGCSSNCSKNVTLNNIQPCIISGNSSFCTGGSSNLCAPAGASSYSWNTGATTQCILVNAGGNYSVSITNTSGCSSSCNKQITKNNAQPCTITGNNSTCEGGSINLCASGGAVSYLWSNGETAQCIVVSKTGTYSVTAVNESGCSSTCNKSVTVDVEPLCSISGNSSFCPGGSTNLCAPAGATSYLWSTGETTQCVTVKDAGDYSVTITNANECSSTCTKNVSVLNPPNCSIAGNLLICTGGSSILCATTGSANYLWNTGSTNQCITVSNSGNYSIVVTGANGCTSTCSQNIDFISPPTCNITGNSSICAGGSTSLCASSGAASYLWNTGATTQCINVSGAGIYTVISTGSNGCTSSCSKTVSVNTPLKCSITGANSICSGGSTTLCISSIAGSYEWTTEATTPCISVNSAGTYSVIITDENGCISTCSQTVSIDPIPTCTITGNTDICQGNNTVFTATGGNSYLWNTGATSESITISAAGVYSVVSTNTSGCSSSCSRTLAVNNCGISLKKTSDICEFKNGVSTKVNFKYVIKNTGTFFDASGNLADDSGTPDFKGDDVNVCVWGPVAPGDSVICNREFIITNTHTNIAKAVGTSGGASVTATASATVTGINCNCNLNYPDNSNLPRSAVIFNESEVLRASDPGPVSCGSTGSVIKLWYNDEHALLLGIRSVTVKTSSGITTTNYNITPTPTAPTCFSNPLVGDTISSGDQSANDLAAGGGRPLWPAIFVTDLTVNGPNSRKGDWQQGGKGIPPTAVCGTWKSAIKTIDKTRNPAIVTITTDRNPAKNDWNLGSGSHTPSGGFAGLRNEGYGAEVSWDVNSLGLIPGHTYRLVFMVHDGDQNKTGGDVGETCTTIHIPEANCIQEKPETPPPTTDKVCYTGTSNKYVKASQQWTINTTTNQATIRTTFSKNFVDNTFGLSAIGWTKGHIFNQLVGSDHLQMALYDANNVKKMEFKLDYITASGTAASGYKCLGVTGGEGSMLLGNATDVVSATTSLDKNLNTFGYVLTTNSPASNSNYTPNSTYPNWIYDVWYEVTVNLSAFGSVGFGRAGITSIHASPSKTGSNSEIVVDTICTQAFPRMAAPDAPSRINAIAYPNPFGNDFTINFITPLEEEAEIIITDMAGRVVESSRHSAGKINMGYGLKSGIYFVRITQGEYSKIIKIIKSGGME